MRWISPDQIPEQKPEKQHFSLLSCLLSTLLCFSVPCSSKESSQQFPKPQNPKPDLNPETKSHSAPNPKARPHPRARSLQHNFDITRRSKISYKPPNRYGPAVIYGLDPTAQIRRSNSAKAAKVDEKDLEGFAVAKKSSNPEKDFKESMVRMIRLKRISRPEDLENLLACYLVLNSDEYQDVIVKVFRQIWIEISSAKLRSRRRPVHANRRG
ncbi:Transcription repressor OFP2 [Carex littledalei]|uniref:Transcription repressor n=1 Tax=Carex littledalei TaxID=544730 RepID=A0A833VEV3_9POAL|nr:Transcription repressor OFP2 [Carex littledalei]